MSGAAFESGLSSLTNRITDKHLKLIFLTSRMDSAKIYFHIRVDQVTCEFRVHCLNNKVLRNRSMITELLSRRRQPEGDYNTHQSVGKDRTTSGFRVWLKKQSSLITANMYLET